MAYSSFTLKSLKADFGIHTRHTPLKQQIQPIQPSHLLLGWVERSSRLPLNKEKSKSEALVFPVLAEIHQLNLERLTLFSGEDLNADDKVLKGEVDFILSAVPEALELAVPIFTCIEAKKDNIDDGLAQCGAQMLGAQIYNKNNASPLEVIFGCVTTGNDWLFLRLIDKKLDVDTKIYSIANLPDLLGMLQWVVDVAAPLQPETEAD